MIQFVKAPQAPPLIVHDIIVRNPQLSIRTVSMVARMKIFTISVFARTVKLTWL
jgi:hypothetical protein